MAIHAQCKGLLDSNLAMEANDDRDLLNAIAVGRDRAAFSTLFERHRDFVFSLAYHILRNAALAEDAVQETMLTVWLTAGAAPVDCSVRSWVLGIVSTKSLNLGRSQKRRSKREEYMAMERNAPGEAAADGAERKELIALLNLQIQKLPTLDAQMLACCFGANMSHRKIGELLGVPQRTVSDRIQQAIAQLRSNLSKAGVAAVVPLLSADSLYEAMTTGRTCPPHMIQDVLRRLDHPAKNPSRSFSRRRLGAGRTGSALAWGLAMAAALGVGGIWWASRSSSAPVPSAETKTATSTPSIDTDAPVNLRWSFEDGPLSEFKVVRHNWKWQRVDGKGVMVSPAASGVTVKLPVVLQARPMLIKLALTNVIGGPGGTFEYEWAQESGIVIHRIWSKSKNGGFPNPPIAEGQKTMPIEVKLYLYDRYMAMQLQNQTVTIREARLPYPANGVQITLISMNLQAVEARSLRLDEFPEELRDLPKLIKEIQATGAEPSEK